MSSDSEYSIGIDQGSGYPVWRAIDFRHVPAAQNNMRHLLYVNLEDTNGTRLVDVGGLIVRFRWEGMRQDETPLDIKPDKSAPEPHCNIALYPGQITTAWVVEEGVVSDSIVGVHTGWPSDGEGNEYGHHSFSVTFRKVLKIEGSQIEPAGVMPIPDVWEAIRRLQESVLALSSEMRGLAEKMGKQNG